jgi:alkylation response protein AidB-like acyl-CoA dehydrogenase
MRGIFGGRRRSVFGHGKELGLYRNELFELTSRIDTRLAEVADDIDALRRRALDPEAAVAKLTLHEEALDADEEALQAMLAPEDLHGLHMEYEANLERALRGIVTVERGCSLTRLPHRPPDDEEPFTYYKRGHANVTHARLRMAEIVEVLLTWEPGQPAEATVTARMERQKRA